MGTTCVRRCTTTLHPSAQVPTPLASSALWVWPIILLAICQISRNGFQLQTLRFPGNFWEINELVSGVCCAPQHALPAHFAMHIPPYVWFRLHSLVTADPLCTGSPLPHQPPPTDRGLEARERATYHETVRRGPRRTYTGSMSHRKSTWLGPQPYTKNSRPTWCEPCDGKVWAVRGSSIGGRGVEYTQGSHLGRAWTFSGAAVS